MSSTFNGLMLDNFRVQNALNFINAFEQSNLYLLIGRTAAWAENEDDAAFIPPPPQDTLFYKNQVWNDAIGALKVQRVDAKIVAPRVDWGDPALGDDRFIFRLGDVVVVNSIQGVNNHPQHGFNFIVYRCIATPTSGTCSIEGVNNESECIELDGEWTPSPSPGGVDNIPRGTQSGFDSGDGYVWDYLYTIPASEQSNYVTPGWIVVPTPDDLADKPEVWEVSDELGTGRALRVAQQANAAWVALFIYVSAGDFSELIENNLSYRQFALAADPLVFADNAGPVPGTEDLYTADELIEDSAAILYIENRPPISKSVDQTEEIQMIFQF